MPVHTSLYVVLMSLYVGFMSLYVVFITCVRGTNYKKRYEVFFSSASVSSYREDSLELFFGTHYLQHISINLLNTCVAKHKRK
jgi:hypothetical protein